MLARFLAALFTLPLLVAGASAQTGGSAFVLDRYGNHREGNSFERLDAVFLSAGRGVGCVGAGLADGEYYFQITDPAGTMLLTPDPLSQRKVLVSGGVLAQYLGSTRLTSNKGPCNSSYVRLFPFLQATAEIGEYKLWLTRVQDYDPQLSNLFGFDPALSKSDNFRVYARGPQAILRGHKFYDHSRNGTWDPQVDPLEVAIGGWRVELYKNNVLDGVTYTDRDGWYTFIRDRDSSTYEMREVAPGGFVNDSTPGATWQATTARTGTAAASAEYVAGPEFGNVKFELSVAAGRPVTFWDQMDLYPPAGNLLLLSSTDPVWRNALNTHNGIPVNLRNPITSLNPATSVFKINPLPADFGIEFTRFRYFIRRESFDHAGHLLSREVAATLLNNACGFMQGTILIDRHGDGVLVSLEEMFLGVFELLSDPHAGDTGPNTIYQDLRHMMQMCTNEFGRINDTGEPGSAQVVYRPSSAPPRIETPYTATGL